MAQCLPLPAARDATLDPARLNALSGGSTVVAEILIGEFAASNAADRRALRRAFAQRDLAAIGRIAHAVRSAAQAVGAAQAGFDSACAALDAYLAPRFSSGA